MSLQHVHAVHHEIAAQPGHFLRGLPHAVFDPHLGESAHPRHNKGGAVIQLLRLLASAHGQKLVEILVFQLVEDLFLELAVPAAAVESVENDKTFNTAIKRV